jgi:1,4-dihydroxy-2-naphthoate octaprenyltransferase
MTIERVILDPIKSTEKCSHHEVNQIGLINAQSKNRRMNIMVIGAALGLIACLLMLTSYKGNLSGEAVGIISTISGIFGACLKDAYSFEFGSSRGSKDKDEKISSAILEKMK